MNDEDWQRRIDALPEPEQPKKLSELLDRIQRRRRDLRQAPDAGPARDEGLAPEGVAVSAGAPERHVVGPDGRVRDSREAAVAAAEAFSEGGAAVTTKAPKYTVVVMQSHKTAQVPNHPSMAFVLETAKLSDQTFKEFREAAEKGGCAVSLFVVPESGIEHVKHQLRTFSATTLD
jgi:hypothetical protein